MEDSPRRYGAHGEEGTPGFSLYSRCLIGALAGPRRIRRSAENLPAPRKKTESMIGRKRTPSRCSLGFVRWPPAVHRGRPHRRGLPRRSPGSRPGRQTLSPGYAPCGTRPAGRPRHPQTPTSRLPCEFRRILSVVSEKVHDLLLESASRAVESGQAFTLIPPPTLAGLDGVTVLFPQSNDCRKRRGSVGLKDGQHNLRDSKATDTLSQP